MKTHMWDDKELSNYCGGKLWVHFVTKYQGLCGIMRRLSVEPRIGDNVAASAINPSTRYLADFGSGQIWPVINWFDGRSVFNDNDKPWALLGEDFASVGPNGPPVFSQKM